MAKQIIKGAAFPLLLVAIGLLTAATSYGQSSRTTTANIPFDFVVGNTTFQAGEYNIDAITQAGELLRISKNNTGQAAVRLTSPAKSLEPSDKTKLVFHQYGSNYYLAEVWSAGAREGRQLLMSAGEKAAQHELAAIRSRRQQNPGEFERVEIAAKIK